ncbi:MAG: tRNA threonylcarbamoyladenosine dehydratase [Clostridiales bacterium]|nr:tRNA threonylcarbamoyladenosine dehydratase [Clostridiales bacterium]
MYLDRIRRLIGEAGVEALKKSHIAVIGVGGVGSFAAEALVRSGAGALTLIDGDAVEKTNLNRQLHATQANVGVPKVDAMRGRLIQINPGCRVTPMRLRYPPQADGAIDLARFDCVLDCIDSPPDKEALIVDCINARVPVVSCMGAGNRLDPSAFRAMDIYETSMDPLARVMRARMRKRGVKALRVVCSLEAPRVGEKGGPTGSAAFATGAAGLLMAYEAVAGIALSRNT